MTKRILIFLLCFSCLSAYGQERNPERAGSKPVSSDPGSSDELLTHLRTAETYQRAGDLQNADLENRALLAIALRRFGRIAIEEGKYADAVSQLRKSIEYSDTAENRTNLAIAYLRQKLLDQALKEANAAVSIDPNHIGAHYILGNIFYTKEDYKAALPELERVFAEAPDFEIARALGLTYLNLKMPERAREHFKKMRSTATADSAGLHILFAKFYERTNYPADAELELERAFKIEPNKLRTNFYLGYLLLQNGGSERLNEAGAAFERELKLTPNDFYSNFFAGVVASSENDHAKAISLLSRAVRLNPNSGEAHLFLAQSQIELKDLADAEKNLRRAIELEKNGGKNTQARRTHYMLGRLLLKTGRKEEARKELKIAGELQQKSLDSSRSEIDRIIGQVAEKSELGTNVEEPLGGNVLLKLSPERARQLDQAKAFLVMVIAQGFNNLGVISTQNGALSEAVGHFSEAFEWNPELPNLSRNFGIVSFRANEFKRAISPLSVRLKSDPDDILIRKMLGSSYYFTKEYEKSVNVLLPLRASIIDDPELAYFYGISLVQLKRNKDAAPVFRRLAEASQADAPALFYAAQGFVILGDYARAINEFKRVLTLSPGTPKANYFIGQSFIRLNRLAEAESAFSREIEISSADALSRYHLALTLIERKIETDRAIRILEEAISLRYDYADAHYQLGKIYLERDEKLKAITHLESAASADAAKDYIHYQLSIAYRKMSRTEDADRELKLYQKLKNEKRKTDNPMPMGGNEN